MELTSKYRSALMGFSALWIYYFHIVPAIQLGWPELNLVSDYLKTHGFCGVDIFLLLSGFGLVSSFAAKPVTSLTDYSHYLCRRLRRIWIVIIPVACVIGLVDRWSVLQFIGRCTGILQLAVDVYDFLWFVPCILIFYLLAPFYYNLYRKSHHCLLAACIIMTVWIVFIWALRNMVRADLYAILNRVPVFLLGICFGELRRRGYILRGIHYLCTGLILAAGLVYSYALSAGLAGWYLPAQNALVNLLIAPGIVLLGSLLCERMSRLKNVLLRKLLRAVKQVFEFFGTISLEFYAVQEWVWLKMQNSGTLLRLFGGNWILQQVVAFSGSILAAFLVHRLTKLIPSGKAKVSGTAKQH